MAQRHPILTTNIPQDLRAVNVPSDGGCLFYSVAFSLLYSVVNNDNKFQEVCEKLFGSEYNHDHQYIREELHSFDNDECEILKTPRGGKNFINEVFRGRVVDEMGVFYKNRPAGTFVDQDGNTISLDDYLDYMKTPNSYGGELEIEMMSRMLSRPIYIYQLVHGTYKIWCKYNESVNDFPLHLLFLPNSQNSLLNHYQCLLSTELLQSLSSRQETTPYTINKKKTTLVGKKAKISGNVEATFIEQLQSMLATFCNVDNISNIDSIHAKTFNFNAIQSSKQDRVVYIVSMFKNFFNDKNEFKDKKINSPYECLNEAVQAFNELRELTDKKGLDKRKQENLTRVFKKTLDDFLGRIAGKELNIDEVIHFFGCKDEYINRNLISSVLRKLPHENDEDLRVLYKLSTMIGQISWADFQDSNIRVLLDNFSNIIPKNSIGKNPDVKLDFYLGMLLAILYRLMDKRTNRIKPESTELLDKLNNIRNNPNSCPLVIYKATYAVILMRILFNYDEDDNNPKINEAFYVGGNAILAIKKFSEAFPTVYSQDVWKDQYDFTKELKEKIEKNTSSSSHIVDLLAISDNKASRYQESYRFIDLLHILSSTLQQNDQLEALIQPLASSYKDARNSQNNKIIQNVNELIKLSVAYATVWAKKKAKGIKAETEVKQFTCQLEKMISASWISRKKAKKHWKDRISKAKTTWSHNRDFYQKRESQFRRNHEKNTTNSCFFQAWQDCFPSDKQLYSLRNAFLNKKVLACIDNKALVYLVGDPIVKCLKKLIDELMSDSELLSAWSLELLQDFLLYTKQAAPLTDESAQKNDALVSNNDFKSNIKRSEEEKFLDVGPYLGLREDKSTYIVDKTLLIRDVCLGPNAPVFLRPSGFFKTTNLSMLAEYFLLHSTNEGKANQRELFENCNVWKREQYNSSNNFDRCKNQGGQFPVIYVNFENLRFVDEKTFLSVFQATMAEVYQCYEYLLHEETSYKQIKGKNSNKQELIRSLRTLCGYLNKRYDKKVVLLINEYDMPVVVAKSFVTNKQQRKNIRNFMRDFISNTLKDNKFCHKVICTGVYPADGNKLMSALTQLIYYKFKSDKYSSYFGLTEVEVKEILGSKWEEHKQKLIAWYGQYRAGEKNPCYLFWPPPIKQLANENDDVLTDVFQTGIRPEHLIIRRKVKKYNSVTVVTTIFQKLLLGQAVDLNAGVRMTDSKILKRVKFIYECLLLCGFVSIQKFERASKVKVFIKITNQRSFEVLCDLLKKNIEDWKKTGWSGPLFETSTVNSIPVKNDKLKMSMNTITHTKELKK